MKIRSTMKIHRRLKNSTPPSEGGDQEKREQNRESRTGTVEMGSVEVDKANATGHELTRQHFGIRMHRILPL